MVRNAALATALFVGLGAATAVVPTAQTKNGSYIGKYSSEYDQDFFLGIPYAQPPVGDLRFRNPVGLNTTWEEPKPATEYSPEVCCLLKRIVITNPYCSVTAMAPTNGTIRYVQTPCRQ
jgi:hypothetical protein